MKRKGHEMAPVEHIVLDRVTLYSESKVDAELMHLIDSPAVLRMLEHEDACAKRHILRMFGRKATFEFKCPATWWQHLKSALRTRWPRLFRRIKVTYRIERLDTGAVVAGLAPIQASRTVIPFYTDPEPGWSDE